MAKLSRRGFFRSMKNILFGEDPILPVLDEHPFYNGELALDLKTGRYKVWFNNEWQPADELDVLRNQRRELKAFRDALAFAEAATPNGHGSADITYRHGYQKALRVIWEHLETNGIHNTEKKNSAL